MTKIFGKSTRMKYFTLTEFTDWIDSLRIIIYIYIYDFELHIRSPWRTTIISGRFTFVSPRSGVFPEIRDQHPRGPEIVGNVPRVQRSDTYLAIWCASTDLSFWYLQSTIATAGTPPLPLWKHSNASSELATRFTVQSRLLAVVATDCHTESSLDVTTSIYNLYVQFNRASTFRA